MSNPILSSILKAIGGAAVVAVQSNLPQQQTSGRKRKTGGCTPCAARARVEAARRAVHGK